MSSAMAWRAASLISEGAAKSGKPCERLTAWCSSARRVISRMTDSVNCSALADSIRRASSPDVLVADVGPSLFFYLIKFAGFGAFFNPGATGSRGYGRTRRSARAINHPVDGGIAQDDLHVLACLGERNGFDELGYFLVVAFRLPESDAIFTGVVGRGGVFRCARKADQIGDVQHAQLEVVVGIVQKLFVVTNL